MMQAAPQGEDLQTLASSLVLTTDQFRKSIEAFAQLVTDRLQTEEQAMAEEIPDSQGTYQTFEAKPMDEEPLYEQAEVENPEVAEEAREDQEARVLGIDFPTQFPQYIEEALFRQLRSELYSKDNSMKLNEALNFNIYGSSVLKGFNSVDVEESIKYYRENYDLDLREAQKTFVSIDNIELKPADLFRLVPMVFLNDSTINYYIKVIGKHILDQRRAGEFHFFNTYFFSKIRQEISNLCMQQDIQLNSKNRHLLQPQMDPINKKMRGWFKRIKLFQRRFILLPINKKDHWFTVAILNLPSLYHALAHDTDVSTLPPEERPCILLMDPLVNVEDSLDLMLRLFLESELKEALGPTYELKQLAREMAGDTDRLLITEKNLPHYQLIVSSF